MKAMFIYFIYYYFFCNKPVSYGGLYIMAISATDFLITPRGDVQPYSLIHSLTYSVTRQQCWVFKYHIDRWVTVTRWLQLRFDFDSTAVRLLIKGH